MKNKIIVIIGIIVSLFMLSGCAKEDTTFSMTAYTSTYPTEYILDNLYGEKIAIYSIYPDGINYKNYKLTNKQLSDYSKGDLFVYNGTIKKEKDYAVSLLNKNKNIKVIDASLGMTYSGDPAENWLNPSNYLMMASNIKKGLEEYINEKIETDVIDSNYEELKLNLSEIDAELKQIATNASNTTIVVSSDTFKYLEKYGFNVISLEENNNLNEKTLSEVRKLLANKKISYIFLKDDEKEIAEKEQEEKKKIQKEWDSVNKRTKTIPKNQGTKKDSEVHPKEAAEQEEKHISKKKSKDSGQMSLFDMMQPKES